MYSLAATLDLALECRNTTEMPSIGGARTIGWMTPVEWILLSIAMPEFSHSHEVREILRSDRAYIRILASNSNASSYCAEIIKCPANIPKNILGEVRRWYTL